MSDIKTISCYDALMLMQYSLNDLMPDIHIALLHRIRNTEHQVFVSMLCDNPHLRIVVSTAGWASLISTRPASLIL